MYKSNDRENVCCCCEEESGRHAQFVSSTAQIRIQLQGQQLGVVRQLRRTRGLMQQIIAICFAGFAIAKVRSLHRLVRLRTRQASM